MPYTVSTSLLSAAYDVIMLLPDHVDPIVTALSILHNFTIESQVQFHAPLAFKPQALDNESFGLTPEDLTVFINSAEWTLCKLCLYRVFTSC